MNYWDLSDYRENKDTFRKTKRSVIKSLASYTTNCPSFKKQCRRISFDEYSEVDVQVSYLFYNLNDTRLGHECSKPGDQRQEQGN